MLNITTENTPDAPRIEFPCQYPVKVMGEQHESFHIEVLEIFRRHAPGVADEHVTVRASGKGTYVAMTVVIHATGKDQLDALFTDLKRLSAVKLVL